VTADTSVVLGMSDSGAVTWSKQAHVTTALAHSSTTKVELDAYDAPNATTANAHSDDGTAEIYFPGDVECHVGRDGERHWVCVLV
jgi:hypothetical protein